MKTLLLLVVVDYVSGIVKSLFFKSDKGKYKSKKAVQCIFKKVGYFVACFLASIVASYFNQENIFDATVIFFIVTEMSSIIENLAIMGVPMPKILKNYIENALNENKGE